MEILGEKWYCIYFTQTLVVDGIYDSENLIFEDIVFIGENEKSIIGLPVGYDVIQGDTEQDVKDKINLIKTTL